MSRPIKIWLVIAVTLLVIPLVLSWQHIPQIASYHQFCDQRSWLGINNFANVVSNGFFLIVGLRGWGLVWRSSAAREVRVIYSILFFGVVLTALGSGFYHLHPNDGTLVWDRLPMTIVFMAFTAAVIAETIGLRAGQLFLAPLLLAGMASVWWWQQTQKTGVGDLRLYILVQYYPMLLLPLLLVLFPLLKNKGSWKTIGLIFGWYALAKVFEGLDCPIYSFGQGVSGHTLKHLAAAAATAAFITRFKLLYINGSISKASYQMG